MSGLVKKSVRSEEKAYIRFINKSKRDADVFWLDYEGSPVKYHTMKPDSYFDVDTFIGHPWVFKDGKTGDHLVVNHEEYFLPPKWKEIFFRRYPNAAVEPPPHRLIVMVTLPVYSLRERCLQIVRDNLTFTSGLELDSELELLQLPKSLQKELVMKLLQKDGIYVP